MKAIQKSKQNNSFPLSAFLLVIFIVLIAFVWSLRYAGRNKAEFPELTEDKQLPSPVSSTKEAFHNNSFSIVLSAPQPYKIYYTTDGSAPSLKSDVYQHPIVIEDRTNELNNLSLIPSSPRWKPPLGNVFKGTVLRAIAVTDDNRKGPEYVQTFFVNEKKLPPYTLPVIALTVNADDLFGYKNGIYVLGKNYDDKDDYIKKNRRLDLPWWEYPSNYLKRGDNAERPVHIEYIEKGGKYGFSVDAGLRINGNATRGYSQKSLRICFDQKYGLQQLNYELFPDIATRQFNAFILRNSGNDWDKTMFRDAFMQSLMKGAKLDIQAYQPAVVFINGEYWGLHNIRERFDEHYISNKYGISTDSIVVLELGGNLFFGKKNDERDFHSLLDFIDKNDLSDTLNYNHIKEKIDIESFMDFIISNVYFCNNDWPNNNVKFWRYKSNKADKLVNEPRDGRWRWMLYDTDWGFGYTGDDAYQLNLLEKAKHTGSVGVLFSALLTNEGFCEAFKQRFSNWLHTAFETDHVIDKINAMQRMLEPEMHENINRWRKMESYENWLKNIEVMRNFARKRPSVQVQQLNDFLHLQGDKKVVLK
jgi:hypothetical protein